MRMEELVSIVLSDDEEPLPKPQVSTLVFLDLEATGLPGFVGAKNVHITEMSLIAIDRREFENDSSLRVLNKLSLCIRPRAVVSPTAKNITGLYNDNLEHQEKFDETIPKLLEFFFRRLKRPLCLLAHNGKRYDFPLLKAELQNINYALDSEILCADTLEAFRFIENRRMLNIIHRIPRNINRNLKQPSTSTAANNECEIPMEVTIEQNQATKSTNHTSEKTNSNDQIKIEDNQNQPSTSKVYDCDKIEEVDSLDEYDVLLSQDLHVFEDTGVLRVSNNHKLQVIEENVIEDTESLLSKDMDMFKDIALPVNNVGSTSSGSNQTLLDTPTNKISNSSATPFHRALMKPNSASKSFEEVVTPPSKIISNLPPHNEYHISKRSKTEPVHKNSETIIISRSQSAKRQLFAADESNTSPNRPAGFSLEKLYSFYFGEDPPVSHYAEADCIALSKVCQKASEQFLPWLDENCLSFDASTKPMW